MHIEDATLALAGMFQAAYLVRQVAREGRAPEGPFLISINSVLKIDAPTTADVYSGALGLRTGLEILVRTLGDNRWDREVLDYLRGLLILEGTLRKRPDVQERLRAGLERAAGQAEVFSTTHPNVLANLAGLYTDTLSTFKYRIHVYGEPAYLQNNPPNVDKVRALLLAGVRSAVLWRQKGGGVLALLLARKKILLVARRYLHSLATETTPSAQ